MGSIPGICSIKQLLMQEDWKNIEKKIHLKRRNMDAKIWKKIQFVIQQLQG